VIKNAFVENFLPAMNVFANLKELGEYLTRIQKPYVSVDTRSMEDFSIWPNDGCERIVRQRVTVREQI